MLIIEFNKPIPIKKAECEKVACGICKETMMRLFAKDKAEYFKCSGCGAETWPELKDDTPEKMGKAARKVFKEYSYDNLKAKNKKGGGSKSKSGSKKKLKPVPMSQRFKLE